VVGDRLFAGGRRVLRVAADGRLTALQDLGQGTRGFSLYDLSTPAAPRRLCGIQVTGPGETSTYTDAVALAGDHLFVAGFHRQLVCYDISDPEHPVERDRVVMDRPGDLAVVGDRLFAGGRRVLRVAADGRLTALQDLGQGPAEDLLRVGGLLHAAVKDGVATFVVDDPDTVVLAGLDPVGSVRCLAAAGDLVFAGLTPPSLRLKVIDYADPLDPRLVADVRPDGLFTFDGMARVGDALLVGDRWLRSIDISDPARPVFAPHPDEPAYPQGLAVLGDRAVVVDGYQANVYALGNGTARDPVATWDCSASIVYLAANHRRVYLVRDRPGVVVLDPAAGTAPVETQTALKFGPVAVDDSLLVTGDGGRLRVFSLADPDAPAVTGHLDFGDIIGQLAVRGPRVLVALARTRLVLVDVSDPSRPVELGRDPEGVAYGAVAAVAWADSVGYAYNGNGVLRAVRAGADGVLETIGVTGVFDQGRDLVVRGGVAYALGGGAWGGASYLAAVDLTDPRQPATLGRAVEPNDVLLALEPADGFVYALSMGSLRRYWPECRESR